jgi:C1A family cysteine protease
MADEGFCFGNRPDPIDHRDLSHFSHEEVKALTVDSAHAEPTTTSSSSEPVILSDLPPVYCQLKILSCTANAVAAALRYAHRKLTGSKYADYEPSRLWIYYQTRILAHDPGLADANEDAEDASNLSLLVRKDTGSSTRGALRCLARYGVCQEKEWPYGNPSSDPNSRLFLNVDSPPNPCAPKDFNEATLQAKKFFLASTTTKPTPVASPQGQNVQPKTSVTFSRILDVAAKVQVQSHADMSDADWRTIYNQPAVALLERCLRDGLPFIFSTQLLLGASLNSSELGEDAVFVKPPTQQPVKGPKHTMLAVGFDPGRKLFLVQNSWGPEWPKKYTGTDKRMRGRFWMPYDWFEATVEGQPLTYDFWVLKLE